MGPQTLAYEFMVTQGTGTLLRSTEGTSPRKLKRGHQIEIGDVIETEASQNGTGEIAELTSKRGNKITLEPGSRVEITENSLAAQSLTLSKGKLLGATSKGGNSDRKYKFMIRTRSATMGIRGTQFVVEAENAQKKSSFFVIEGVVDIASSVENLLKDNFIAVGTGQLVTAVGDGVEIVAQGTKEGATKITETVDGGIRGLSSIMPFDVLGFVANLNRKLPEEFHMPFLVGEDTEGRKAFRPMHWSSFELFSQHYWDSKDLPVGRQAYGYGLSWNPTLRFENVPLELRGHLGVPKLFKGGKSAFEDIEVKGSASKIFKNITYGEIGTIILFYPEKRIGFGLSGTGGVWFGDRPLFRVIDRIFLGLNMIESENPSLEYRLGLGAKVF